eukprot:2107139-Amphidinium_carterae.1
MRLDGAKPEHTKKSTAMGAEQGPRCTYKSPGRRSGNNQIPVLSRLQHRSTTNELTQSTHQSPPTSYSMATQQIFMTQ